MPLTRGIKCAWCDVILENDFILEIHERIHQNKRDINAEIEIANRNRKRRN